jgi:glycosyltransferase involved in cell wall biosynthesis
VAKPLRFSIIGPTYPFRGGLAHFTTLLVQRLRERHQVRFYSYSRQYPAWLFPGNTNPDPSAQRLQTECERWIDALNPLTYLRAARNVVADAPDALILQWWTPFWLPLHMIVANAARQAGIPVIYLCHQLIEPDSSPMEWQIARLGLRDADAFIVMTRRECEIIQQAFPGNPARVAHHPVYDEFPATDLSSAAARIQLGLNPDLPVLLNFGFVRRYKGISYLLEALAQLQRPVQLVIAGEFWEPVGEYQAQVERLGLRDRVIIHDRYIANEQIAPYFRAADALVLPYLSGSQSGVAMIAVHYGLPVIATNVGGLAETIVDGVNGLIVPPANSPALAQAIDRLLSEDLIPSMRIAMEQTRNRLSWAELINTCEELTHEQIARTSRVR